MFDQSLEMLLVVDDLAVERALRGALERAGHRVVTSSTIAGSFEVLSRQGGSFDVIMIDLHEGNGSGDDAERYARWLGTKAKVIVLPQDKLGVANLFDDVS
ncbi:MAG: hypothetical protein H6Q90_5128 [Deltaproteobacteria bacterium]|nr:hypothetical protein [Deltaproteobacteria bacterium]